MYKSPILLFNSENLVENLIFLFKFSTDLGTLGAAGALGVFGFLALAADGVLVVLISLLMAGDNNLLEIIIKSCKADVCVASILNNSRILCTNLLNNLSTTFACF